jgi:hypothetical protein
MNINSNVRTPYNQMPITMALKAIDRKVYRDMHCLECGRPFIAISDKFITIIDAAIPVQLMRGGERVIEARCSNHYCKQYYHVYV